MKIQIISLFPEMFKPVLETSMLFKAKDKGITVGETSLQLIQVLDEALIQFRRILRRVVVGRWTRLVGELRNVIRP